MKKSAEYEEELRESRTAIRKVFLNFNHEVRTPLNAIIGFADLILAEVHGPIANEDYRTYLKDIRGSGRRLLNLLSDLLELAKLEVGSAYLCYERVSLKHLLHGCVRHLQGRPGAEDAPLSLFLPDEDIDIEADEAIVRRAVLYVVENALGSAEPGRPVAIRLDSQDSAAVLKIEVNENKPAKSRIPNMAQVLERRGGELGEYTGNTALGLSIAKQFIEVHQGSITIESSAEFGIVAKIVLPLRQEFPKSIGI